MRETLFAKELCHLLTLALARSGQGSCRFRVRDLFGVRQPPSVGPDPALLEVAPREKKAKKEDDDGLART